jgi:acetoin utilization protein AcuB
MYVADVMTANPITINQDDTLHNALEIMDRVGCRHLPVLGSDRHLVGILSDRDCRTALNSPYILREQWQDDDLANHLPVRAMMTPAPIIAEPDTPANEAARLMLENKVSCLPVMRGETLIGIVTTSDILFAFIRLSERVQNSPFPPNGVTHKRSGYET